MIELRGVMNLSLLIIYIPLRCCGNEVLKPFIRLITLQNLFVSTPGVILSNAKSFPLVGRRLISWTQFHHGQQQQQQQRHTGATSRRTAAADACGTGGVEETA